MNSVRVFSWILVCTIIFLSACTNKSATAEVRNAPAASCQCDTIAVQLRLKDSMLVKLSEYDQPGFLPDSIYSLSETENERLWYRDVENPFPTKFTPMWNDYVRNNYHADHSEFLKQYNNKDSIELAFQFGPAGALWAYHIFVIRKMDCCYLITRSYFAHARFTYKAYSILQQEQVDSLYGILNSAPKISSDSIDYGYRGYFADNRNRSMFGIDFESARDKATGKYDSRVLNLFDFVDKKIAWKVSYEH